MLQQYLASHLASNKCHASAELHAYSNGGLLALTASGSSAAAVASNLEAAIALLKGVAAGASIDAAKTAVSGRIDTFSDYGEDRAL